MFNCPVRIQRALEQREVNKRYSQVFLDRTPVEYDFVIRCL